MTRFLLALLGAALIGLATILAVEVLAGGQGSPPPPNPPATPWLLYLALTLTGVAAGYGLGRTKGD